MPSIPASDMGDGLERETSSRLTGGWREDLGPRIREFRYSLHLLKQSPLAIAGLAIFTSVVLVAALAPWIAPYGPTERIWEARFLPPSWEHPFGTDNMGGDIFSRIIWAAQLDLKIMFVVVLTSAAIGCLLGAISGFAGGKVDEILMRVTDVFLAFPPLILAMAVAAALGRSMDNLMIALIIVWWPWYARLIRGQVLVERERPYVEAARAIGAAKSRIIFRHVLPNSIYPIIVEMTLDLGSVLLTAAGLSFIGFGAQPGIAEWGSMIAEGRNFMLNSPWLVFFPGLAILFTALSLNAFGDGLRDILDPRLRR
ncbi:MAG: ABC transporter permease [Candidatus Bathyarchaeia archaeon]